MKLNSKLTQIWNRKKNYKMITKKRKGKEKKKEEESKHYRLLL
jgi:hypothetical protein